MAYLQIQMDLRIYSVIWYDHQFSIGDINCIMWQKSQSLK